MFFYPFLSKQRSYLAIEKPVFSKNQDIINWGSPNFAMVQLFEEYKELLINKVIELTKTPTRYPIYFARDFDNSLYLYFKDPVYDDGAYYYSEDDDYFECMYIPTVVETEELRNIERGECELFYLQPVEQKHPINIF